MAICAHQGALALFQENQLLLAHKQAPKLALPQAMDTYTQKQA